MKRKWFQIHLSTAIVMMFAAGLGLWSNVPLLRVIKTVDSMDKKYVTYTYDAGGWPFHKVETRTQPANSALGSDLIDPAIVGLNASLGLTAIFAIALISEYLICRREVRAKIESAYAISRTP